MMINSKESTQNSNVAISRVAIVGAGVAGRVLALLLKIQQDKQQLPKFDIHLYDRQPLDQTKSPGWISAGMVAPWAELNKAPQPVHELGKESLQIWPELLSYFGGDKTARYWNQTGTLVAAFQLDQNLMTDYQRLIRSKLANENADTVRSLATAHAIEVEPELKNSSNLCSQFLYFPMEGQISPRAVFEDSEEWLNEFVHFHHTPLTSLEDITDQFDLVYDCRGLGAKEDILQDGDNLHEGSNRLRPVRGEVVRIRPNKSSQGSSHTELKQPIRLLHPRFSIYLAPQSDGSMVIGATEIESDSEQATTIRSTLELLSTVYSLFPHWSESEVLELSSGLRPTFSDHIPATIDLRKSGQNIIRLNGLYRHGWLASPALAKQAIELTFNSSFLGESE